MLVEKIAAPLLAFGILLNLGSTSVIQKHYEESVAGKTRFYTMIITPETLKKVGSKTMYFSTDYNGRSIKKDVVTLKGYFQEKKALSMEPFYMDYKDEGDKLLFDKTYASYKFSNAAFTLIFNEFINKNKSVAIILKPKSSQTYKGYISYEIYISEEGKSFSDTRNRKMIGVMDPCPPRPCSIIEEE